MELPVISNWIAQRREWRNLRYSMRLMDGLVYSQQFTQNGALCGARWFFDPGDAIAEMRHPEQWFPPKLVPTPEQLDGLDGRELDEHLFDLEVLR